jgi:hypothetical protein
MSETVHHINEERKKFYKTKSNTPDMFPVGTRVQVICVHQDFTFFEGTETGTVKNNLYRYLGIYVEFDEPIKLTKGHTITGFNFNSEDLIVIKNEAPKRYLRRIRLQKNKHRMMRKKQHESCLH